MLSLGTIYNSPFWIFYSSNEPFENEPFDRLSQLKGKRIAVGPVGSRTRSAAEQILGKGGVNSTTATLLPFGGTTALAALNEGKVDAVWTAGPTDAPTTSSLLRNPSVRPMRAIVLNASRGRDLAVQLQNKSKHAMGRRVLGAKIDREIAKACFRHGELRAQQTPLRLAPSCEAFMRFPVAGLL